MRVVASLALITFMTFDLIYILCCDGVVDDDMENIIVAQFLYVDVIDSNKV